MPLRPILQDALARLIAPFMRGRNKSRLRILMFHGLTDSDHSGIENCQHKHLHVARFEALLEHLKEYYSVVSMDELVRRTSNHQSLPSNAVILTFDDGFLSHYTLAFPLLKRYDFPATVYLATQFVENKQPIWVDRLDYAMNLTAKSKSDPVSAKKLLKALPQEGVHDAVCKIETDLDLK